MTQFELHLDGWCSDYEGNDGRFTVRIPLQISLEGGKIRIDCGKPKTEWTQDGRYTPSVGFDDHSYCSEAKG